MKPGASRPVKGSRGTWWNEDIKQKRKTYSLHSFFAFFFLTHAASTV